MATLISAHDLSKTYGARPLFENITFMIESGERIGLIGPNGAGKSSLLRILAGQTTADEGNLSMQRGLKIGYLEQTPMFEPHATVLETVLEGTKATAKNSAHAEEWESMALAQELMSKLKLEDGAVDLLSGGWKKRVALARELAKQPDLLLLDEPTNHLDVESILWLEDFLTNAAFATLTVTHDRLFLQRIANRILELDRRNPGGLLSVKGDYAAYLDTKSQMMAAQERREVILRNTLRRETEWLRRGAKARTTKQQARIKRAGELKDEVGDLGVRNQSRTAKIDFQSTERNPKRLIDASAITKTYGGRTLFRDLDLMITPGTRIGLLGPNGCGKSTLIRVLVGQEEPDQGNVTRSDSLAVAYFEQNREALDPEQTVAATLCPRGDHVPYRDGRIHIRSYLDRFLFSPEQMDMRVGNLSGGEQSRLLIAKLMLQEANLLVLDEPTNDLDMATLSVLEDCLTEFNGAVVFVTHDRYFLDHVATRILDFAAHNGDLVPFADISQWENWQAEQAVLRKAGSGRAGANVSSKAQLTEDKQKKRKLSYNEQRELDSMEQNIAKAEAKLAALEAESSLPDVISNSSRLTELSKAMSETQSEIERLYARWSALDQS